MQPAHSGLCARSARATKPLGSRHQGVSSANIPGRPLYFALMRSQFSLRAEALPLEFALPTPYALLSYALLIITSCTGSQRLSTRVTSGSSPLKWRKRTSKLMPFPLLTSSFYQALSAPTPNESLHCNKRAGYLTPPICADAAPFSRLPVPRCSVQRTADHRQNSAVKEPLSSSKCG